MSEGFSKNRPFEEAPGPDESIICEKCQITFKRRSYLFRHMRTFHPKDDVPIKGNQICGICTDRFRTISQLHTHLEINHNVCLKFINEVFYCKNDFLSWKKQIEKEGQSSFILRGIAEKKNRGVKQSYYMCHRSGIFKPKIVRARQVKDTGSVKSGCTCPAIINVTIQTVDDISEIRVLYQSVHVGHGFEVSKLPLSKEDRTSLALCLNLDVPISQLAGAIRKKYPPTKKIGLITPQDLRNICRDFKIERKVTLYRDDAMSVDILVKQMQNDTYNPILIYKPRGDLLLDYPDINKEEILLGIMNETQENLLECYGSNCIMVDSTYKSNQYNFHLTTILVHEVNNIGLPVATLFSSRVSEKVLLSFFTEIKKRLPSLKTNVLMSDNTNLFYDVWQRVFNDESKHLLSCYLINKNLRSLVNTKVRETKIRQKMREYLKSLLSEVSIAAFEELKYNFIRSYENVEPDFIKYFKKYYEVTSEKWAYCYKVGLGIDRIDMMLEQWIEQLQDEDVDGTVMKRLDKTIGVVISAIAKKLLPRIISFESDKLKSTVSLICKLHKVSVKMAENYNLIELDNKYILTKTEGSYIFTYNVEKINETCMCEIKCNECNICIHSFSCTCVDYCIGFFICEHIHYVCQRSKLPSVLAIPENQVSNENNSLVVDSDVYTQQQIMCVNDTIVQTFEKKPLNVPEEINIIFNKLQDLQRRLQTLDLNELKYVDDNINAITEYLDISAACSSKLYLPENMSDFF